MSRDAAVSGLEDHLGYWLRYVSNHVSQAFARKVEGSGVTVAEWVVLRDLFETGATNPSLLASRVGLTRGAVSKLVERLRQKDLLAVSSPGDDRRYQAIELTATGSRLVPALARLADENDAEFFGHLGPDESARLKRVLQDLVRRHAWKNQPVD